MQITINFCFKQNFIETNCIIDYMQRKLDILCYLIDTPEILKSITKFLTVEICFLNY